MHIVEKMVNLLSILNIYKSTIFIVKRSDIFTIMKKIIHEKVSRYITKIKEDYHKTNKVIYLKNLCKFLYKNRYYFT